MEQTSWILPKNDRTPISIYEDFKKAEARKEKRWKLISLISVIGFVASMVMVGIALSLPKTVPLVISVSDYGEAKYLGDISNFSYNSIKVPKECYDYTLKKFISNCFSISSDFNILKKSLNENYAFLTSQTSNKYNILINEMDPRSQFGKRLANVEFISVLNQSKNTYQVDFIINRTQMNGDIRQKLRMRALITVELMMPSKEDVEKNPLGIYITNFDFTEIGGTND